MIYPLKDNWAINEDEGFVPDQIKNRCNSEDNYTWCKGYPLIKEIRGRLGNPIPENEKTEM